MRVVVKAVPATGTAPGMLRVRAMDSSWSLTCPYDYAAREPMVEAAMALYRAMGGRDAEPAVTVHSRTPKSVTYNID